MNPEERINEVATNEHGIDGVIRFWDKKTKRFIGHRLDNEGVYWEATNPQFTGISFVDYEEAKKHTKHESKKQDSN